MAPQTIFSSQNGKSFAFVTHSKQFNEENWLESETKQKRRTKKKQTSNI